MLLGAAASSPVVAVGLNSPLSSVTSLLQHETLVALCDAGGHAVAAVRADAVRRMANRLPLMPIRMMPSVVFREAPETTTMEQVLHWGRLERVEVVLFRLAQGWRALALESFDAVPAASMAE
jgi:hypothetical protein